MKNYYGLRQQEVYGMYVDNLLDTIREAAERKDVDSVIYFTKKLGHYNKLLKKYKEDV